MFFAPLLRMTTANKITLVRILMIPVFVVMAIYYGQSVNVASRSSGNALPRS